MSIQSFLFVGVLILTWIYISIAKVHKKCPKCGAVGTSDVLSEHLTALEDFREREDERRNSTWFQYWFGKQEEKGYRPWKCNNCGYRF